MTVKEIRLGILLLLADQVSKGWFASRDLVVMNRGGVFGIFPSVWWGWALLLVWLWLIRRWNHTWGMGLVLVGGLGNVIDRIFFGSVRDFIYYPGFGFYGNIADIFLFVGVVMVLIQYRHEIRT